MGRALWCSHPAMDGAGTGQQKTARGWSGGTQPRSQWLRPVQLQASGTAPAPPPPTCPHAPASHPNHPGPVHGIAPPTPPQHTPGQPHTLTARPPSPPPAPGRSHRWAQPVCKPLFPMAARCGGARGRAPWGAEAWAEGRSRDGTNPRMGQPRHPVPPPPPPKYSTLQGWLPPAAPPAPHHSRAAGKATHPSRGPMRARLAGPSRATGQRSRQRQVPPLRPVPASTSWQLSRQHRELSARPGPCGGKRVHQQQPWRRGWLPGCAVPSLTEAEAG